MITNTFSSCSTGRFAKCAKNANESWRRIRSTKNRRTRFTSPSRRSRRVRRFLFLRRCRRRSFTKERNWPNRTLKCLSPRLQPSNPLRQRRVHRLNRQRPNEPLRKAPSWQRFLNKKFFLFHSFTREFFGVCKINAVRETTNAERNVSICDSRNRWNGSRLGPIRKRGFFSSSR